MPPSDSPQASPPRSRRLSKRAALFGAVALLLTVIGGFAYRLHRSVRQAMKGDAADVRPLSISALPPASNLAPRWGSSEVVAVLRTQGGLLVAGGNGVHLEKDSRRMPAALPSLRVVAATSWRGQPLVALASGGLFRLSAGQWEEIRTGWGTIHARTLVEAEGGEILIGAREGLYRAAWGGREMERISRRPVRSLASGPGFLLAGGEEGLVRITPGHEEPLGLPDDWVESVAAIEGTILVATPSGLYRQTTGGFTPVRGGDVSGGVVAAGAFWAPAVPPDTTVVRIDPSGSLTHETLPALVRRTILAEGDLLVDTDSGLFARDDQGWKPLRERLALLPDGHSHVSALAMFRGRLHVGLFDGGLLSAEAGQTDLGFSMVPGTSAWGVNALLATGGELRVASLRGAARYDGHRLTPVDPPGAAFSLAETPDGVVIGYANGVLVPGTGLLSAFHGLPGNQALALSAGSELLVGTPTGLGSIVGRRVSWRVTAGEERLPHPWVTSLARSGSAVYVGTYGGGIARRSPGPGTRQGFLADGGTWRPHPETARLKINTGCLVPADGDVYAGTDGDGLWALFGTKDRFERLSLPLPSERVTALLVDGDSLWVGTDEGLTRLPLPLSGQ